MSAIKDFVSIYAVIFGGLALVLVWGGIMTFLLRARPPKEDGISDDYDAPLKRPANGWGDER